jgi:toxin ParE1/3/4
MKVRWTDSAAVNWEQAFDHIAQENFAAAIHIAEKIIDLTELLAVHPSAGRRGRITGTREMVVANSPFILVYGVDSVEEIVWIYAVYHGRRRWPSSFPKK